MKYDFHTKANYSSFQKVVFEVIEIIKNIEYVIDVGHKYLSCSEFFIFNSGNIHIKFTIVSIFGIQFSSVKCNHISSRPLFIL